MNEIFVNGTQNFMGKDIPVVAGGFGIGKKCISDKTVAEIHSMREPDIRRRISDNIKRFKENIDFVDLKKRVDETHTLELLRNLGYAKQSITQAEHIYLLSERGYAKLIKIMDTDLAWEIHDKLIDEYFELREKEVDRSTLPASMQAIYAMLDEQAKIITEQNRQAQKIREIEAKITTHDDNYFTVAGYASLRGLNVNVNRANMLGRKASKLSREYGYDVSKTKDPRFGTVNLYHTDILNEVFRVI